MTRWMLCAAALTIALAQVVRATPIVVNPGFESPGGIGEGASSYTYPFHDPGVTVEGWTFAASEGGIPDGSYDGLSRPGLAGSFTTLTGYEGNQVAFIEVLGSFSQEIGEFNAGTFTVSFLAGGRCHYVEGVYQPQYGANAIQVKLDDTILTFGTGNAETVTPTDGVMSSYTSNAINIVAGSHRLTFSGMDHADHTSLIDSISIGGTSTIPEPSTLILSVIGVAGLICYAWRKRN